MNSLFRYSTCLLVFYSSMLEAQTEVNRAQVVVAYVNNFARNITWPDEKQTKNFKIVIYSDNSNIINEFKEFAQKRKIKDKPVVVSVYPSDSDLDNAQIVLLTKDKSDKLLEVYSAVEGIPVLIVSEGYNDKRNIMINLYETQQKQLLFEINKSNIINQNLSIEPEILLAGGTEIDVAALYRKSQISLRSLQEDLNNMKDSLAGLNKNILVSTGRIDQQQSELLRQRSMLEESNRKLNRYQLEMQKQKTILDQQRDSIANKNKILEQQSQESKNLELSLKSRQEQIRQLNREIENKNKVLGNLSETVTVQKQIMILFIIIGVLSVFLVVSVFRSYRNNKNKKDILAKQKGEIENQLAVLQELNRKLEEADQYKSIFLASMSHELRTPLNSIIGYTGILLMGMTGRLNEEQNRQLNKVKNNARHLLSLINDILDISKIEADRVELQYEELNIKSLIQDIGEIMHPRIIEKGLTLTTEIPENMVVMTDIRRIKQVVLNLVSNAVSYSDTGNIHIRASQTEENKFNISVKDTGIGISENEISRLFQPFQQIDSSLTKKNKGTGLGLYLCKKLTTLLGGNIYVKSEFGKGSEFFIELPVRI